MERMAGGPGGLLEGPAAYHEHKTRQPAHLPSPSCGPSSSFPPAEEDRVEIQQETRQQDALLDQIGDAVQELHAMSKVCDRAAGPAQGRAGRVPSPAQRSWLGHPAACGANRPSGNQAAGCSLLPCMPCTSRLPCLRVPGRPAQQQHGQQALDLDAYCQRCCTCAGDVWRAGGAAASGGSADGRHSGGPRPAGRPGA